MSRGFGGVKSTKCMYNNTVHTRGSFFTVLEINFKEADYSITEGKPLSVLMQLRRTQSPFNITLRPVSIASAEDIGLGDFINCAAIWNDSRAIPGTKCMDAPEYYVGSIVINLGRACANEMLVIATDYNRALILCVVVHCFCGTFFVTILTHTVIVPDRCRFHQHDVQLYG